jgi:mono/diheme cytochrome c family protein
LRARVLTTLASGSLRAPKRLLLVGLASFSLGCWEQVSPEWFAQMKEQPAVQALESGPKLHPSQPLRPPAGTIPLGGMEPRIASPLPAFTPEARALPNPIPNTPESQKRGKYVYDIYCKVCHGADGMAKQDALPVAQRLAKFGAAPVPLVTVRGYTDGFLFTKIRYGKPLMPAYPQIPAQDRWHVVNYLRTLFPTGG